MYPAACKSLNQGTETKPIICVTGQKQHESQYSSIENMQ